MQDAYDNLVKEITELRRQMANMLSPASIKDVKGDKVRMSLGRGADGKDVLGPWTSVGDRRGGATVRNLYTKGQNVWVFSPSGDPTQAVLLPGQPNKEHSAPEHATDDDPEGGGSGEGGGQQGQQSQQSEEETYQQKDFRKKFTPKGGVWFLQEPQQKQQQQEDTSGDMENGTNAEMPKRQKQKPDGRMLRKMEDKKGITDRVGKDARMMVGDAGAKLKKKGVYIVAGSNPLIQGAVCYFSHPPQVRKVKDPLDDDDETDVGSQQQQGSQQA